MESVAVHHPPPRDLALFVIACFKLVKGGLLLGVAIGAFSLIHRDVGAALEHFVESMRADPGNRYIHGALSSAGVLTDRKLEEISLGTFVYAGVFFLEGFGLLTRKRWAEFFTLGITASFVPLELYELAVHASVTKVVVLLVNAVIIGYLVWRIRREKQLRLEARAEAAAAAPAPSGEGAAVPAPAAASAAATSAGDAS